MLVRIKTRKLFNTLLIQLTHGRGLNGESPAPVTRSEFVTFRRGGTRANEISAARVTLKRRYFSLLPLFLLFQMNVSKGEGYDFYHDRVIGSNLTDVIKKGGGKEQILKI